MDVLLLASRLDGIGGIARYNNNLLRALNELRCGVSVVELTGTSWLRKFRFFFRSLLQAFVRPPDIIICTHVRFSLIPYLLKKIMGIRYCIVAYGIEFREIKNIPLSYIVGADRILTVSAYTVENVVRAIPGIASKIFYLYAMVDGNTFKPEEKSKKLIDTHNLHNAKVIVTVSRLASVERYKGYDMVIEALLEVLETIPNAKYVVIGDGDDKDRVARLIEKFHLEDKVILVGSVCEADLIRYYNIADVFVMPSKHEGFGLAFLEALACGKPVITGNQDGSLNAILYGEIGTSVDPCSIHEIASAIVKILNKECPPHLVDQALLRRRVLEEYGFDRFVTRMNDLLNVFA